MRNQDKKNTPIFLVAGSGSGLKFNMILDRYIGPRERREDKGERIKVKGHKLRAQSERPTNPRELESSDFWRLGSEKGLSNEDWECRAEQRV
jgi:hypothetical protein